MSDQLITLSIEPTDKPAFQHGFHLGTDERVARQIAAEMFHARNDQGDHTCTVALIRNWKIFDVYDGRWTSECGFENNIYDDEFDRDEYATEAIIACRS